MSCTGDLQVIETVDMPKPKSGEVLIKVAAAPVNPSDYGEWKGEDRTLEAPRPIGKEGSGIVVASGGGAYAATLVGKSVGFTNLQGYCRAPRPPTL
jgi:NADPH:quinone reductase-like Zn-dependent oxidoreductase